MTLLQAIDKTSISYSDQGGSGPSVLFVHGITESAETWDPVVELLQADHRVITMDLRGHGKSGTSQRYDLEAMAGDVAAVVQAVGLIGDVHLVGHSLGGAVVSAVGASLPVASIVNVDQSLQLGAFRGQLVEVEAMLRNEETFRQVIDGLFTQLAGPLISPESMGRVSAIRAPDQQVVLGVWNLMFTMSEDEINQVVAGALGGYAGKSIPYLSLFGFDPGPGYEDWLASYIGGAQVELWSDHGHYPHLVDPDRFVSRLRSFWSRDTHPG